MIALAALTAARLVLATPEGAAVTVDTRESRATAVVFVSTVCPISNEYEPRYLRLFESFARRGVRFVFVYPNRTESDAEVRKHAADARYPFPVYRDPGAALADLFEAEFTPTAVVIDREGVVRYQGRVDDSVNPARVKDRSLESALKAVLAGRTVAMPRTKAFG